MFVAITILRTPGGGRSNTSRWFTVGISEWRGMTRSDPEGVRSSDRLIKDGDKPKVSLISSEIKSSILTWASELGIYESNTRSFSFK